MILIATQTRIFTATADRGFISENPRWNMAAANRPRHPRSDIPIKFFIVPLFLNVKSTILSFWGSKAFKKSSKSGLLASSPKIFLNPKSVNGFKYFAFMLSIVIAFYYWQIYKYFSVGLSVSFLFFGWHPTPDACLQNNIRAQRTLIFNN
jgi:hypothetical protein